MREREEGATINNSPGVSSALDGESLLAGRATLPLSPSGSSNYKA